MKRILLVIILNSVLIGSVCLPKQIMALDENLSIPCHVLLGAPRKSQAYISPNGKQMAYLAPNNGLLNIWVKTLKQDDDRPITHGIKNINGFFWAKNNKHILFTQDRDGDEQWHIHKVNLETLETTDITPFDGITARFCSCSDQLPNEILITMNKEDSKLFDVYHLNILSGDLKLVTKNPGNVDIWLADNKLCVRAAVAVNSDGSTLLLLRDNENAQWVQKLKWDFEDSLAGSIPPKGSRPINFSNDGKFLYLIDSANNDTQRLLKLDLSANKKVLLFSDIQYDIDSVSINPITHEPDIALYIQERRMWKALDSKLEKDLELISSINDGDLIYIDRNQDDTKWILSFKSDNSSGAYYLYDLHTKKSELLFYDKPELLSYKLPSMHPISFKSRDGLTIHGYLTCPMGKQPKDLPLVLDVHGGPWLRNTWGYNEQAQWLASLGIASLQVNFRGSTGYGKDFVNSGDKEWAGKMHNDLIDAVNWVVNEGIANPQKIAIAGMSYGGYAALVGAAFTPDVFCCAVDISGPSNLVTMLDSIISFNEMGRAKFVNRLGNPEIDTEFLQSRSPLFKVDQIKIPVFIAHGGNDPRIKQREADQIVEAMNKKGVECEYMLFPNEGHQRMRPENEFRLLMGVEKFLTKHLLHDE